MLNYCRPLGTYIILILAIFFLSHFIYTRPAYPKTFGETHRMYLFIKLCLASGRAEVLQLMNGKLVCVLPEGIMARYPRELSKTTRPRPRLRKAPLK